MLRPVGMDPLNAGLCAQEACRRLGKGVVMPTLYMGTERERPAWMLESLGLVVASTIEMLLSQGYKAVVIVNGHGASNQLATLDRLAKHYSSTTDAVVSSKLADTQVVSDESGGGHADLSETSLMLHFEKTYFGGRKLVDLSALPPRKVPIRYKDYSVVDDAGFSRNPHPDKVVQTDPRDATPDRGRIEFGDTVAMYVNLAAAALAQKAL